MIAELFTLLSTVDSSGSGGTKKFHINLNRNHIRSISAYSSNSIFYFTTCIPDDVTPGEMGMISRMLEKSYASFVVTCISLMPFHRVKADDKASIEDYLSQFHQNLNISSTRGDAAAMGRFLGLVDSLEESVQLPISEKAKGKVNEDGDLVPDVCPKCGSKIGVFLQGEPIYKCTNKECGEYFGVVPFNEAAEMEDEVVSELQDFLMECWEKSRRNCSDYIKIVSETISLNDMYQVDPIDPKTRLMQETYRRNMEELETWGFLGEATADMFDISDEALESMSDAEIIQSVMGVSDDDDDDFDLEDLEDEYEELDAMLEANGAGLDLKELEAARQQLRENWEKEHPGIPMPRGHNRAHDPKPPEILTEDLAADIHSMAMASGAVPPIADYQAAAAMYDDYGFSGADFGGAAASAVGGASMMDDITAGISMAAKVMMAIGTVAATAAGAWCGYNVGKLVATIRDTKDIKKINAEIERIRLENNALGKSLYEAATPITVGAIGGLAVGGALGYNKRRKENDAEIAELHQRLLELELHNLQLRDNYKKAKKPLPSGVTKEPLLLGDKLLADHNARAWKMPKIKVPKVKLGRKKKNETAETLTEGNVKQAIDHIMFSLESVSENKILSCSSLTKLNALESKLNKLKNKYAKYLNRYKKKYQENKKKKSNSKLSIRFNGATITNPKAFMKQFGSYIKIINKRLKLVEKRRAELRKRKGIPEGDTKMQEAAMTVITEADFRTLDYIDESIQKQLDAPDSEIFILTEADYEDAFHQAADTADYYADLVNTLQAEMYDMQRRIDNLGDIDTGLRKRLNKVLKEYEYEVKRAKHLETEARKSGLKNKRNEKEILELKSQMSKLQKERDALAKQIPAPKSGEADFKIAGTDANLDYDRRRPKNGLNIARAAANGFTQQKTFGDKVFTDMEMKKANEAVPTFAKASIGFIVDETEQVVNRDVLVGIKVQLHKQPAMDMIDDIYNCLINKRKFLKWVKFISGEEKSLADLLFGFKALKLDAVNSTGAKRWNSAFRRRQRWSKMSVPYLMKNYTPNGTVVVTMNEVQFIRDEYGLDIMRPDHVKMLMDEGFLLGFVVLDQANEMVYVTYDGHGGEFQQYTYAMLEREQQSTDRMMRELYRSISR